MAIVRRDSGSGAAGSASFTTSPNAGDYIVIVFEASTATTPTLPAGYTSIAAGLDSTDALGIRVAGRWAATGDTMPTSTGATSVSWALYSGVSPSLAFTQAAGQQGTTSSMNYAGIVSFLNATFDWVVTTAVTKGTTGNAGSHPGTAQTLLSEYKSGSDDNAIFDSNGPVSSYSFNSKTLDASVPWFTKTFELIANQTGNSFFGQVGDGTNTSTSSADANIANRSTEAASSPSQNGTLVSVVARLWLSAAGSTVGAGAIWDSSGNLLATGDEITISNTAEQEVVFTFSGANAISLTAGTGYTYGISWKDPGTQNITWSRQTTSSTSFKNNVTYTTGSPQNPLGSSTVSGPIDMYVVYTPSTSTTTTQTTVGKSRITATTAQIQTGKAHINSSTTTTSQTTTGKSRITVTTPKTQLGKANVQVTTAKTQTGKAYIAKEVGVVLDSMDDFQGVGYSGAQRKLITNSSGRIFATYRKKDISNSIYQPTVAYSDNGTTWTPVEVADIATDHQRVPSLAVGSDSVVHLVWYGKDPSNTGTNQRQIKYSHSGDNGATWSSWISVGGDVTGYTSSSLWQEHPCIVVDPSNASNLYVVWEGRDSTNPSAQQIKFSKSTNGGTSWSSWTNIFTDSTNSSSRPSITITTDGKLHVLFYSNSGTTGSIEQILHTYSSDSGSTWSTAVIASGDNGYDSRQVGVVADGTGLHATWRAPNATYATTQVQYAHYNGSTWSSPVIIAPASGLYQFAPQIGEYGGVLMAVWSQTSDSSSYPSESPVLGTIYLSTNIAGTWSAATQLTFTTSDLYPNINAVYPSLIWSTNPTSTYDVRYLDFSSQVLTITSKTQTGKARVTQTTPQTITGKSRVTATTTRTQTGKARIQQTDTKTQTGISRITQTTPKTIQGLARVTAQTTRTTLGKARITASKLQTQPGRARVQKTDTQTQTGKSRVTIKTLQTILGKSRLTAKTSQTQLGKARVQKTTVQTQLGEARITQVGPNRTNLITDPSFELGTSSCWGLSTGGSQTGLTASLNDSGHSLYGTYAARMEASTTGQYFLNSSGPGFTPVTGVKYTFSVYVYIPVGSTLNGVNMGIRDQNNYGYVQDGSGGQPTTFFSITPGVWTRLSYTAMGGANSQNGACTTWRFTVADPGGESASAQDYWIDGAMFEAQGFLNPYFDGSFPGASWSGTANASTSSMTGYTQTGISRITVSTPQTTTGNSRITAKTTQTILGKASITGGTTRNQLGKANIKNTTTRTQLGKGSVLRTTSQTLLGKSRITVTTLKTQIGLARVTATTLKAIQGLSRVTVTTTNTILGKASISGGTVKTQLGKARVTTTTKQTQLGKSRLTVKTAMTQLGKGSIQRTTKAGVGGGMVFDGVGNYLSLNTTSGNLAAASSWSFVSTFLSYGDSAPNSQSQGILNLMGNYAGATGLMFEITNGRNPIVFGMRASGGAQATGQITYGVVQTVGYTWDGTNLKFYINGNLDSTISTGIASTAGVGTGAILGSESASINAGVSGGRHFNGEISDVRGFTNRVLTSAEMSAYNAGTLPTITNMAIGYNFSEKLGITTADISGNGATATRATVSPSPLPYWVAGLRELTGISRITNTTVKTQSGLSRVAVNTSRIQTGKARITVSTTKTVTGVARVLQTRPTDASGNNLVYNGNFENAPATNVPQTTAGSNKWIDGTVSGSGTNTSFGWGLFTTGGGNTTQFDNSNSHSGNYSLKVSTTTTAANAQVFNGLSSSWDNVAFPSTIPLLPNTAYTLTYWMKTNLNSGSATTGARMIFSERDSSGNVAHETNGTGILTTTGWTQYVMNVTTGSATRYALLKLQVVGNDGTGTLIMDAWFDDLVLLPSQDITGLARIQITTPRTTTGKSRIQVTDTHTITGISRVTETAVHTQFGKSRVTTVTSQIQTGKTRITQIVPRDTTGISRVVQTVDVTTVGRSNIQYIQSRNIFGVASILSTRGHKKVLIDDVWEYGLIKVLVDGQWVLKQDSFFDGTDWILTY